MAEWDHNTGGMWYYEGQFTDQPSAHSLNFSQNENTFFSDPYYQPPPQRTSHRYPPGFEQQIGQMNPVYWIPPQSSSQPLLQPQVSHHRETNVNVPPPDNDSYIPSMVFPSTSTQNGEWAMGDTNVYSNPSGTVPKKTGRTYNPSYTQKRPRPTTRGQIVPSSFFPVNTPPPPSNWTAQVTAPEEVRDGVDAKQEGRRRLLEEAALILTAGKSETFSSNDKPKQNKFKKNYNGNYAKPNFSKNQSWRNPDGRKMYRGSKNKIGDEGSECQRVKLTHQLLAGNLECLVCCEFIRPHNSVWSCSNCHHILHLKCTIKWASSSKAVGGWRCPACQNITPAIPVDYLCMCGKVTHPEWVRGEVPHCCGQICGKNPNCTHHCTLLCHPGPCPPCSATVERSCGCGRTSKVVACSTNVPVLCEAVCDKLLNCGIHTCESYCHIGPCEPCQKKFSQVCYCEREKREVPCDGQETSVNYSCGNVCPKKLNCGVHPCVNECHPGDCPSCPLLPEAVTTCPCGKSTIQKSARKLCTDPIPTCNEICDKLLRCGPPGNRHSCKSLCHEGECPPCPDNSSVKCRCGLMTKDLPCIQLTTASDDVRCQKKCTKKRSCGKHKCNQLCCIELDHLCPLPCNRTLQCGQHICPELCHKGYCPPCLMASFEELHCECGQSVMFPPIPCGTKPPECSAPCSRQHPCDHPPQHHCHSGPTCPPCSVLTSKYCYGAHELRKTLPCHIGEFSCGRPCGALLPCGHKCLKECHKDTCLVPDEKCTQPCAKTRPGCGHPCGMSCHPDVPCNFTNPCNAKVTVTCECKRRTALSPCHDTISELQKANMFSLANKLADVKLGKTVDFDPKNQAPLQKPDLKLLDCNEECRTYQRNLRLAMGLQIVNPDLSSKLQPNYSEFMKTFVKTDPKLCEMVHEKLSQLVQLAKTSKQKSRSYSFESMGRKKRQFVHEYCKFFGCESVAYDPEPNRNIVATAYKDKCWLPSYSLMEVVNRESNNKRKVALPPPLPSLKKDIVVENKMVVVQTPSKLQPVQSESPKEEEPIDYFDYKA